MRLNELKAYEHINAAGYSDYIDGDYCVLKHNNTKDLKQAVNVSEVCIKTGKNGRFYGREKVDINAVLRYDNRSINTQNFVRKDAKKFVSLFK